jgi:hypothetical protein
MSAPALLIGATLAFWGWQSGNLVVGLLLGTILELARQAKLRVDLGTEQHSTIADLSTIGFVLLAVLLGANRGIAHGVIGAFVWLPVALAPILLAQLLSAERRLPLSALFRYLRKLRRQNPDVPDPMVDVSAVYVALVLLSAGIANLRGPAYYVVVVVGAACLLYAARPRQANLAAGAAMLLAAAAAGYGAHHGLARLQAEFEDWVMGLNLIRMVDADPYRSRSELGSLGRLKLRNEIILRVYPPERGEARAPYELLHRGSYNSYTGNSWVARGAEMQPLESEADNLTWILSEEPTQWRVRIASKLDLGRALLGLPPGTSRLGSLPANQLRRNALGAVHATLGVDWVQYEAQGGAEIQTYAAPSAEDRLVPPAELAVFERAAAEMGLAALPAAEALRRIERHFGGFSYATFRDKAVPAGETALGDFMTRTRAGHCEYFAAAATLLLRAAGIPARYATGYAVMEYSVLERAYVVRARHAHAWTRAWVEDRWVDLDPTPPAWFGEEERRAPLWEGLSDLFRWAGFAWSTRDEFKASDAWFALLPLLAAYLVWSVTRGRKRVRAAEAAAAAKHRYPGEDSEFYALEKSLPERLPGETHGLWLTRIAKEIPPEKAAQIQAALRLHQRYRFDPEGLAPPERRTLRELCGMLTPQSR